MRVVFLGTPTTAVPTLEALLDDGHDVARVLTQPDRPSGRSGRPQPSPVKQIALARGLTVLQPARIRVPEVAAEIAATSPDALVVVAYGRMLPRTLLDAARHGAINVHFSLLPELRGAAPVQWALARGYDETGVTTFRIDEGLDTGALLLQEPVAVRPGEHAPSLLARLAETGARLLLATLAGLEAATIEPRPQAHARATQAPLLTREDGWWEAGWTAAVLEGRVRGFDPWPGVWALCGGTRMRIVGARAVTIGSALEESGTVIDLDGDSVRLACADGTLAAIESVQFEGRRAVTAREAWSGRQLAAGDRLGRIEPAA